MSCGGDDEIENDDGEAAAETVADLCEEFSLVLESDDACADVDEVVADLGFRSEGSGSMTDDWMKTRV